MKLAVIGFGNMGRAIVSGMLHRQSTRQLSIVVYDNNTAALNSLPAKVKAIAPSLWISKKFIPDCILIAVKPADIKNCLEQFKPLYADKRFKPLWISIAAGITIDTLQQLLPEKSPICRVMPNTPALIGQGIAAYALNKFCKKTDAASIEQILNPSGQTVEVSEKQMNAVTGLSGSGPAYVYLFIEALIEGGVSTGLSYAVARQLAVQTVIGSAGMVAVSNESPAVLKSRVMSPGGTTVSGLLVLEENKFKYAVMKAVAAATQRAEELGKSK